MFEINGNVKEVFDLMTFDSGFTKREFVLTTEEDYPQDLKFECVKDRCQLVDELSPGDRIKVRFDLRGREWKGKYFVNLNAWKIEASDAPPGKQPGPEGVDEEVPF